MGAKREKSGESFPHGATLILLCFGAQHPLKRNPASPFRARRRVPAQSEATALNFRWGLTETLALHSLPQLQ